MNNINVKKIGTTLVFLFLFLIYFGLLPITIESRSFRFWLIVILIGILFTLLTSRKLLYTRVVNNRQEFQIDWRGIKQFKWLIGLIILLFGTFLVLNISTFKVFNSARYRNLIEVDEQAKFTENVQEIDEMQVPIVDENLAFRLGDKKIGEIKGLGSQFTVRDYTMIDYNGKLYWVGALEYTGFFKWLNNRNEGVPGYIRVSATNPSDVELVEDFKMKYVSSAYFNQDFKRKIYFSGHMTDLMTDFSFEIDETGHPYWVVTDIHKEFAWTSGRDTENIIVMDAVTGEVNSYSVNKAPEWIDRIQPADVVMEQLNYWGRYVNGYWNSVFAKKEVLRVTEGYNYVYNNGDFYLYTGLTSVGADESTVGFVLTNMRTKETKFYPIGGATESAARKSAEGAVQDLGYVANWPILVNFNDVPTYFMTLKDNEGLIKQYAYVNVKDYSVVGIGKNLEDAQRDYLKTLGQANVDPNESGELKEITGNILIKEKVNVDGTTYYYIVLNNLENIVFTAPYTISYELPLSKVGERVTISYFDTDNTSYNIEEFDNETLDID
ncbi:hypothetical protein [Haloplasma contractile]|uniref:Membrane protein n=1 Tax=Haloplasma contractile SSD-17B TaxID=1033810 RepID=U2FDX9_9MOLU|nr:hypothetical protein [Haloplasma contractile]ERJ11185.1 Putative membrane protein [Haloplasma contractile SSD-17B]